MAAIGKISVLGIGISRVDYKSAVDEIISCGKDNRSLNVTAIAVHGVMEGYFDREFANKLNSFDIVTPDGQPIKWALNILGAKESRERVCGPVLMLKVCERAAAEKVPLFFYGSTSETLARMKDNIVKQYPDLIIAGMQADRFRDATTEEDERDIALINKTGAGIVFVGRGCPRQEKWVASHMSKIKCVMISVGAAFDFHAGLLRRPPKIIQDMGLEWAFRLAQEPKRLWRRYLILNPLFVYNFCLQIIREKLKRLG